MANHTRALCVLLAVCSMGGSLQVLAEDDPPELTRLRTSYETAVGRAKQPLEKRYRALLEALRKTFVEAGNLDAVVSVRAEQNGAEPELKVTPPPELADLKAKHEQRCDEELADLKVTYIQSLEALQRSLTRRDDLAGAIKVRDERELVNAEATGEEDGRKLAEGELPETAEQLAEYIVGTRWVVVKDVHRRVCEFHPEGRWTREGKELGYEVLAADEVRILFTNSRIRCQFSDDFKTMTELQGRRKVYRIIEEEPRGED